MSASKQLPKIFLLLSVCFAVAVAFFAIEERFGGSPFEPLERYPTHLSPIPWSLYAVAPLLAGMAALSAFQFFPKQRVNKRLARSRFYLTTAMLLFGAWAMAWCYGALFASAVAMTLMVAAFAKAAMAMELRVAVPPSEVWLARAPVALFFGWSTTLAVVNWATLFRSLKWKLQWLSPEAWAALMLAALALFSLWFCLRFWDLFFIGAVVWGFLGIALKQDASEFVSRTAWLSIFVMILAILIKAPRKLLEEA
ncbi:MAG: hypothetical protein NZM06_11065 [Chloroherpetonaceae bacterium]|nr:hypothetical protein [Chloroherpetonaceae bacterium]MDW8438153.1 hypothetical protein [Chloroherpetonaceae bacterium]